MDDHIVVLRTYKYRLYPRKSERRCLDMMLDQGREVYNAALMECKLRYQTTGTGCTALSQWSYFREWRKQESILLNASSLQHVLRRVDKAYAAFFRRLEAGEKPGYPRFKGEGHFNSLTYTYGDGCKLHFGEETTCYVQSVGEMRVRYHRPLPDGANVKQALVKRSVGKWYLCLSYELKIERPGASTSDEQVGIDLGLTTFAMFSNGEKIKRQRWVKRDANDIARLQRKKARLPKGSVARRKVVRALNHAYQRSNNRRGDFAHKESHKLVERFGLIVFEKLNIQGMQSNGNRVINRGIADVAWGRFVEYTCYKAEEAGRKCILVNPKNTTQECSGCGWIVPKDLSVRVHRCPNPDCRLTIDRDLNAALNILRRGLASLGGSPGSSPL